MDMDAISCGGFRQFFLISVINRSNHCGKKGSFLQLTIYVMPTID